MRKILAFIRLGPSILFNYFWWIKKCSKHPEKLPLEVRYRRLRKIIFKTFKVLNMDVKLINQDYFVKHKGTSLIVCNHRCFFDPCFFIALSEKPVIFVAKDSLTKVPFLGKAIKAIDGVFINRDDVMSQIRTFKDISARVKKGEVSCLLFPEGTRMKEKGAIKTLPFKDGSLKVAYWGEVDIIPAAMMGSETLFDKHRYVTLHFFKPYKYNEFKDLKTTELSPKIENEVKAKIAELDRDNKERLLNK